MKKLNIMLFLSMIMSAFVGSQAHAMKQGPSGIEVEIANQSEQLIYVMRHAPKIGHWKEPVMPYQDAKNVDDLRTGEVFFSTNKGNFFIGIRYGTSNIELHKFIAEKKNDLWEKKEFVLQSLSYSPRILVIINADGSVTMKSR